MRKLLNFFLPVAILALVMAGLVVRYPKAPAAKIYPVTPQQRTSHMVTFLDKHFEREALCTATAIGPHAILTAQHCNDGDDPSDTVTFDLSLQHFHILAEKGDDRDHVIYLLDGPAFTHYLDVKDLLNARPALPGEHVVVYGFGLGKYPAMVKPGSVDVVSNTADISDVDSAAGTAWYAMAILPGDSGAAIFGADGRVLGLTTYGIGAPVRGEPSLDMVGFALNFSEHALEKAHAFSVEALEQQLIQEGKIKP